MWQVKPLKNPQGPREHKKMALTARPARARVSAPEAATGAANVPPQEVLAGGTTPAVGAGAGSGAGAGARTRRTPPNLTNATVSIMETVVPTIPDVTNDDIERKMPYPALT